ncbi:MAG: hypothetical protein DWQ04_12645 [Chloroflexi bacterium]|nr:MAG: hypothetical protein DWQ04_12645 [Chloroflexota bacterium]
MSDKEKTPPPSTLAALLKEKPKRGRPPHAVSRQNVYVALTQNQKAQIKELATKLPKGIVRADVPDLAITILSARMEALRRAVSGRDREIPEGITDLESLYLLWDIPIPNDKDVPRKWTSVRLSPQPAIELGRVQGMLYAVFSATRSEAFSLGLDLLDEFIKGVLPQLEIEACDLAAFRQIIIGNYL